MKRSEEAISDYSKAIQIDPNAYSAYFQRAILYRSIGNYQKALADFNRSIEINSNDPLLYINRAYLKRDDLNDNDGACTDLRKAQELGYRMSSEDMKGCTKYH